MFDILLKTLQDATPMLIGLFAMYIIGKSFIHVVTAQSPVQQYSVAIGAHKKRLSALE